MRTPRIDHERIAELAHELNRSYCKQLGDQSQVPWYETSAEFRESTRSGVHAILAGKVQKPQDSHESWMVERVANGWKHGEVKDVEKKEHPCLVAFEDLPRNQQIKDRLFLAVVLALSEEVIEG